MRRRRCRGGGDPHESETCPGAGGGDSDEMWPGEGAHLCASRQHLKVAPSRSRSCRRISTRPKEQQQRDASRPMAKEKCLFLAGRAWRVLAFTRFCLLLLLADWLAGELASEPVHNCCARCCCCYFGNEKGTR